MLHLKVSALYTLLLAVCAALSVGVSSVPAAASSGLPLPSSVALPAYETQLYAFLDARQYETLRWVKDKRVRDTGPFIDAQSYGTHPAVRIFYSPEVYNWLKAGRPEAVAIPDGAMIVKEMYSPPAARYGGMTSADIGKAIFGWTVMVRDSKGSRDGWFWAYYAPGEEVDTNAYPFSYPNAGFGQYCVRCHASAESGFTFSSLRNIEGEAGEPIQFRVDNSWLEPDADDKTLLPHIARAEAQNAPPVKETKPLSEPDPAFLETFDAMPPVSSERVVKLLPVTLDHVVAPATPPQSPEFFLTSDQCMSCHDGQGAPFGPNMFIPADATHSTLGAVNLSPFGEWNWSMMGLAGRDPIFYAQLETEQTLWPPKTDMIDNLCLTCHGVMGQRQWHADGNVSDYTLDKLLISDVRDPDHLYGALSRDGISCMSCHQIIDDEKPLRDIVTGGFEVSGPVDGVSKIYGPVSQPAKLPMVASLGLKPEQSEYISSSRVCASCHTIFLPVLDKDGTEIGKGFEQVTYLEWLNSSFQDELSNPLSAGSAPQTCQSCHMTDEYHGTKLAFQIANIQDQTYPEADNLAPVEDITVPIRGLNGSTLPPALDQLGDETFKRHTLLGINQFGLELFNQFDDILGVRKTDYMTGSPNGLPTAIAEGDRLAKQATARVEILNISLEGNTLTANVKVTNLTGHRFPSGVGFRRAFLEFSVLDADGNIVWASGRTNALGVVVDEQNNPLPSEFFEHDPQTSEQLFEPHYQTITRQDQVQIYQELTKNPAGVFTTSFLERRDTVKDNRLLPKGWSAAGPVGFKEAYSPDPAEAQEALAATHPEGDALQDEQFLDGSGSDIITYQPVLPAKVLEQVAQGRPLSVTAALYYQAIPPYYLQDRFTTAQGENTQRLYYLTSHLNVRSTSIENWKLLTASDSAPVSK